MGRRRRHWGGKTTKKGEGKKGNLFRDKPTFRPRPTILGGRGNPDKILEKVSPVRFLEEKKKKRPARLSIAFLLVKERRKKKGKREAKERKGERKRGTGVRRYLL